MEAFHDKEWINKREFICIDNRLSICLQKRRDELCASNWTASLTV